MTSSQVPLLPDTPDVISQRTKWKYNGSSRPAFAEPTPAGCESVWDFPRPPRIEPVTSVIAVYLGDRLIAQTHNGVRVVETAGAPTYYFPPGDVDTDRLIYGDVSSLCEWKGLAQNISIDNVPVAGWRYVEMFQAFGDLYLWPAFYPHTLKCKVNDREVTPQEGGYYGGWVTPKLTGPIKGLPGTQGW